MDSHSLVGRDESALVFSLAPNIEPFVTPSLTANLVVRVVLGVIANLVCLVPLRLLYRNGEFAAVVFIIVVEIKNIFTIVMALVWRTDDMESWWPGYGLCDLQPFVYNGCAGIYVTCLLAIMRNLAHQVGILRANPLTVKEKRRRNFVQALIIFPLPIVQLAFTWPLAKQRYLVGTLIGCTWVPSSSWPFLLFFVIAELVISIVAAIYAVITFFRFRQVSKLTSSALTSNRAALLRSQRAKRRLYLMVISILIPFLPITITICVLNVRAFGQIEPFDFNTIHGSEDRFIPWNAVLFMPSRIIDFATFNIGYISILTAIPIFLFFGMTKDALNSYRVIFLFFGLGKIWPSLHNEYDPDRKAMQKASSAGYFTRVTGTTVRTKFSQGSSHYKLSTRQTSKSSSSGDSTIAGTGNVLTRLITPHLASSLDDRGRRSGRTAPTSTSWPIRMARNPFMIRKKHDTRMSPSSSSKPPTLPALTTQPSLFSLQSRYEEDICMEPMPSRRQQSPRRGTNFSLPMVPHGQPHPSEALDLPNPLATLDSSNRSVRFADSTSSDAGDYYQPVR